LLPHTRALIFCALWKILIHTWNEEKSFFTKLFRKIYFNSNPNYYNFVSSLSIEIIWYLITWVWLHLFCERKYFFGATK
jgi:hypothetical protein